MTLAKAKMSLQSNKLNIMLMLFSKEYVYVRLCHNLGSISEMLYFPHITQMYNGNDRQALTFLYWKW